MARTAQALVEGILLRDYDTDDRPSLTPFIRAANVIVTRVAACATRKSISLSSDELREIETWLAAHCYCLSDQTYAAKQTEGANATFHGQTGLNLDSTRYGQMAQALDYSGCLVNISKRQFASVDWLGKRPSEQTDFVDRD